MVWIFFGLFALLSGAAVCSDSVMIGGSIGVIQKNAPFVVNTYVSVLTVFGLLIATAFFNNAALRDISNQFNEIMFSLPIKKNGYFFGRFLGALTLAVVPFFGIYFGILVGTAIAPIFDWVAADRFGPFYLHSLVNSFFLFALPNMFIGGAVIFFMAHKWKNTIVSFVGALLIIVVYIATGNLLSDIENEQLAAMLDIFGIRTFGVYTKYWTPIEKNTMSPGFDGLMLLNRSIWIGFALFISAISYITFSFRIRKSRRNKKGEPTEIEGSKLVDVEEVKTWSSVFNVGTGWAQFVSFYKTNTVSIIKNNVFRILFLFSAILLVIAMAEGYEYFGLQSYPVTYKVMEDISGQTGIYLIIIIVFFSGELVWRDRINKVNEVVNATPHNSFASLAAKTFSLITVASLLYFFFVLIGIIAQLVQGYTRIELHVYLIDFILDVLPGYVVFSAMFILIQTLISNRYVGYFIGILILFVWEILLSVFDISSNMLNIGGSPSIQYSDMNGFGPGVVGSIWFNAYWFFIALIWLMIAGIFWPRSVVSGWREKWEMAKSNLSKKTKFTFVSIFSIWLLIAGVVFYNTQILNDYRSGDESEEIAVRYENELSKYKDIPQPKFVNIKYYIDIYPYKRNLLTKADCKIQNKTSMPIDSIHFNTNEDWELEIDIPGSELVMLDEELGYRIYKLNQPMQPGDVLDLTITNNYVSHGFENSRGNTSLIANGTFINSGSVLPGIGYNDGVEIGDPNTRKKYDLKPKLRAPKLESPCGETCMKNYISDGESDWLDVETIISTAGDQIAIAPGSLIKEWEEGNRNYFHYKVDHPSLNFYSFISARYEVARDKYNGIDVEVYYDKGHAYNIDMMVDAVKRSLAYYEKNFGPYYHKQARIIEFPRYATFAQAFPGTMPYSEAFGFIIDLEDEEENNVIDAVIAHEMAHQWWAHQEISAPMQGGTMLTESFAEYSSLMVMKNQLKDDIKMKQFLKYDFDRYLGGRSRENRAEQPLYKVENQSYIHYGKGSVVLYALQDYLGEDKVNAALRDFLNEYKYKNPPYPTSLDFLKHLDNYVPDSLDYLVEDLIKTITLHDMRLKNATTREVNGKFITVMEVEAHKVRADTLGVQTPIELNDWVDFGVYADKDEEELLNYRRVKVDKENLTVTIVTDEKPQLAAIDPRRVLIERETKDNVKTVTMFNE